MPIKNCYVKHYLALSYVALGYNHVIAKGHSKQTTPVTKQLY